MQTADRTVVDPALQASIDRFNDLRANHKEQWYSTLNNIRYYELRGAGFLSYVAEALDDPDMMAKMTKHAADEGKHAHFLTLMIRREGGKPKSLAGETKMGPGSPPLKLPSREGLIAIFTGMQAIEKRAARIFDAFEHVFADDPVILSMVREVIKDEQFHLGWIAKILDKWRTEGYADKIDRALEGRMAGYSRDTGTPAGS